LDIFLIIPYFQFIVTYFRFLVQFLLRFGFGFTLRRGAPINRTLRPHIVIIFKE
jgi:hypothetical protein